MQPPASNSLSMSFFPKTRRLSELGAKRGLRRYMGDGVGKIAGLSTCSVTRSDVRAWTSTVTLDSDHFFAKQVSQKAHFSLDFYHA